MKSEDKTNSTLSIAGIKDESHDDHQVINITPQNQKKKKKIQLHFA